MPEERRRQRRDLITVPINYSYTYITDQDNIKSVSTSGITLNVSDSGMCFYTNVPLQEGKEINIFSKAIWENPKKGMVKWCRKITEELYRVGVTVT